MNVNFSVTKDVREKLDHASKETRTKKSPMLAELLPTKSAMAFLVSKGAADDGISVVYKLISEIAWAEVLASGKCPEHIAKTADTSPDYIFKLHAACCKKS